MYVPTIQNWPCFMVLTYGCGAGENMADLRPDLRPFRSLLLCWKWSSQAWDENRGTTFFQTPAGCSAPKHGPAECPRAIDQHLFVGGVELVKELLWMKISNTLSFSRNRYASSILFSVLFGWEDRMMIMMRFTRMKEVWDLTSVNPNISIFTDSYF